MLSHRRSWCARGGENVAVRSTESGSAGSTCCQPHSRGALGYFRAKGCYRARAAPILRTALEQKPIVKRYLEKLYDERRRGPARTLLRTRRPYITPAGF